MKAIKKYIGLGIFMILATTLSAQESTICEDTAGNWRFETNVDFELTKTGKIIQNKMESGSWKCDPETGRIKMTWNTGDEKIFTLSADASILYAKTGEGDYDYQIVANKVAGVKKEVPAGLMDKQSGSSSSDPFDLGKAGSKPKEKDKDKKKGNGLGTKGNN